MPDDIAITFVGGPGDGGGTMTFPDFASSVPMIDLIGGAPLMRVSPQDMVAGQDIGVPSLGGHSPLDAFTDEMLGRMGLAMPHGPDPVAQACRADALQYCPNERQMTHCLSQHAENLKPECSSKIQKTLPHVCKSQLETMCDPFNEGIFACLERNVKNLKGKCLDAFVSARHHISAAQAPDAKLLHGGTGMTKPLVAMPSTAQIESKANALEQSLNHLGQEASASANTVMVYGVIFFALAFLFWLSGDGNAVRCRAVVNSMTGFALEGAPKKPQQHAPYGAFSSV